MTLHQLKIFAAVVKNLSITAAAEELHVSQPSISLQIKLLESEFDVKLLCKSGRGIELTPQGRTFYEHVAKILLQLTELGNTFEALPSEGKNKSLIVGGSYTASAGVLPSVLALFKDKFPGVRIILRTDCSRAIERAVEQGKVHVGIINFDPRSSLLAKEPCRSNRLVVFGPLRHPLIKRGRATLSDIANDFLIVGSPRGNPHLVAQPFRRLFEEKGLNVNLGMLCDSPMAVKAAVRSGMGLGVLYEDTVKNDILRGDFKLVRIPELANLWHQSFVICHRDKVLSATAQQFRSLLREWLEKQRSCSALINPEASGVAAG